MYCKTYYFTILCGSYSEVVLQQPKDIREFAAGNFYFIVSLIRNYIFTEYFNDPALADKVRTIQHENSH